MRPALLSILRRLGFYILLVLFINGISFAALLTQENISISLFGSSGDTVLDYACVAVECDSIDGEFNDGESSIYASLGSTAFSQAGLVSVFNSGSSGISDGFKGTGYTDAQAHFDDTLTISGRPGSGFLEFIVSYDVQIGDGSGFIESGMTLGTDEYSFSLDSFNDAFQIPFRFAEPVRIALRAFSTVDLPCCGNSMFADAALTLQRIRVLDEESRPIYSNLRYVSGSNYRYIVEGTGPLAEPEPEPTPEGGTSVLCGTGLLGLLTAALRRKR